METPKLGDVGYLDINTKAFYNIQNNNMPKYGCPQLVKVIVRNMPHVHDGYVSHSLFFEIIKE